eukprot:359972-Chlamydomonas_euryale.AAC.5
MSPLSAQVWRLRKHRSCDFSCRWRSSTAEQHHCALCPATMTACWLSEAYCPPQQNLIIPLADMIRAQQTHICGTLLPPASARSSSLRLSEPSAAPCAAPGRSVASMPPAVTPSAAWSPDSRSVDAMDCAYSSSTWPEISFTSSGDMPK